MTVKKLFSNYQDHYLRNLPSMQHDIAELKSRGDDYYAAQLDTVFQQQKDEWNKKKENFQRYKDKFDETRKLNLADKSRERDRLLTYYLVYKIHEITGCPLYSYGDIANNPDQINVPLDPKEINLPDGPIVVGDLEMLKERDRQRIQDYEDLVESQRIEILNVVSMSQNKPIQLEDDNWLYQDAVYEVMGGYSDDEICLLILEFVDKERRRFERLKNKYSDKKSNNQKYERVRIPEEVRIAVWRRDQGRCARCGSRENLEYDHIVPVSKGGGNTARNVELLCQDCNRSKGDRVE